MADETDNETDDIDDIDETDDSDDIDETGETGDIADAADSGPAFDVRRVRAKTLGRLYSLAEKVLTEATGYRSLYLGCSQYFADEAGDAVHESLTVSSSLWPGKDDAIASYERLDYQLRWTLEWDSNEDAVYAFAPLCDEESWRDDDYDAGDNEEVYEEGVPSGLAIVQRLDGGELRATWVGVLHRPWLDFPAAMKDRDQGYEPVPAFVMDPPMPELVGRERALYDEVLAEPADYGIRDVLRDQWMLRGDPRGEFTAITTASQPSRDQRARAAELVLEHGRGWLGPLAKVVPFSGALFGPGPFVRKAIVYAPDAKTFAKVAHAPQWATVEELSFAPGSARMVTTAMKNLRSVGPLKVEELVPLRRDSWRITDLEIELPEDGSLEGIASLALPLKRLRLRVPGDAVQSLDVLQRASWWNELERLEVWLPGSRGDGDVEALVDDLPRQVREGCLVGVGQLSGAQRTGWLVVATPHKRWLELVRLDARLERGRRLADRFDLELPATPLVDSDDWLSFGIGVAPAPSATESA